ncbi:MAG: metallophosphoesterase [Ignavibacteria bacterium]|nr:metallophosphoesterase [Ignavibacteria bacterium]
MAALLTIAGCEIPCEFSPYDARTSASNYNTWNISQFAPTVTTTDTLHIALLSDTHLYYSDLTAAIAAINADHRISFAVVLGDITEKGLAHEYESFLTGISSLTIPVVTLVGNHDLRSNGGVIYEKSFGPMNFSFHYQNYFFVGFNNIIWENNNTQPDYPWLEEQLSSTDSTVSKIVMAHVPPHSPDEDSQVQSPVYENIMTKYHTMLSLHGHLHQYRYSEKDNVAYIAVSSVGEREYCLLHLCGNSFSIERIHF